MNKFIVLKDDTRQDIINTEMIIKVNVSQYGFEKETMKYTIVLFLSGISAHLVLQYKSQKKRDAVFMNLLNKLEVVTL